MTGDHSVLLLSTLGISGPVNPVIITTVVV